MPTARTTDTHTGLSASMVTFLLTGQWPRDAAGEVLPGSLLQAFLKTDDEIRDIWRAHQAALLQEWQRRGLPGKPWGQRFAANPRMSRFSGQRT